MNTDDLRTRAKEAAEEWCPGDDWGAAANRDRFIDRMKRAEYDRDRLAAVVDRVAAIADAPHLATPEALSTALDNIRAAIEGAESHGGV